MKTDIAFKGIDTSEALTEHLNDRLDKLTRLEVLPMEVTILVSGARGESQVEISILEGRRKYRASAVADDHYRAGDMCINKLYRQMSKERRRVHDLNHRRPERTKQGKLALLNEQLEFDYQKNWRKAG